MNFRLVFQTISWLIALEGVAVCLSSGVAYAMHDPQCDMLKLLFCGGITIASGLIGIFFTRKTSGQPGLREGFAVVTFGWLLISLFGALPFSVVAGMKWYDAVFETVSGFTTTGASVISEDLQLRSGYALPNGIESLPYGILFWRALTHWIGGMGIVVFSLAFLPIFGKGGQALYNAEVPGVKTRSDQFTPRIASTAKILLLVYCGLTLVETILLLICGMETFDAVCHSFATISTGGFSTKNDSIANYNAMIQLIIMVFMFLAGCNFILHFRALNGLPLKDYINEEFRTFFLILLGSSLVIAGYLFFSHLIEPGTGIAYHYNIKDSLLAAAFQVVSISTTTGFSTANYALWPTVAGVIIFSLMFMGGCGGSTSGGIKCMRVILLWKFSLS
ncbi:MAG: TrkH family potassium uptake protein, partial [Lentisphaeria bacterium]|nr:TrkH family potassium uptake protein [Lentisphaeria bacterium]